jgi:carbon-monoxide dehydrogenase medium subunit
MQEFGMNSPEYIAPESLADALKIKQDKGAHARVIAGGTDLILRMRDKVFSPTLLVDLRQVSLDTISCQAGEMRLGAYVTLSQILADDDIAVLFPALVEACRQFAGPPIRNRATLGGNLVNASPAADLAPPLMAYDANIVLASSSGDRVLGLAEFFTGPGQTVMQADEILTAVRLPLMPPDSASKFIKLGQRRSMAISIINLSTRLTLGKKGTVSDARIILGAAAPTPIRAVAAEAVLMGNELSDDRVEEAAIAARKEISPITDVRASRNYRERMAQVLVRRALLASWDDLGRSGSND